MMTNRIQANKTMTTEIRRHGNRYDMQVRTNLVQDVFNKTPYPWQRKVLSSGARNIVVNAPRRSGKTTLIAAQVIANALEDERSVNVVFLMNRIQRRNLVQLILRGFHTLNENYNLHFNDYLIRVENGAKIFVVDWSTDLQGLHIDPFHACIMFDEAAYLKDRREGDLWRRLWDAMILSVDVRKILLSTPNRRTGFWWSAYNEPEFYSMKWQKHSVIALDIPGVTLEFLQERRKMMPHEVFMRDFMGVPLELESVKRGT